MLVGFYCNILHISFFDKNIIIYDIGFCEKKKHDTQYIDDDSTQSRKHVIEQQKLIIIIIIYII